MDLSLLITPITLISFFVFAGLLYKANILPHMYEKTHRFEYIDGLRGIAALLVVCSHSWRFREGGYINDTFVKANYHFIGNLGALGVQLFFCISGFLFFRKIINHNSNINWASFFVSRFKRLAPLYFFFCTCVVCLGVYKSGLSSITIETITPIIKFYLFGFFGNDVSIGNYFSGYITPILWTLPYEWTFYFSLPFLSLIIMRKRLILPAIIISAIIFYKSDISSYRNVWVFFISGGLAAFAHGFSKALNKHTLNALLLITLSIIIASIASTSIQKYSYFRFLTTTILFILLVECEPKILKAKSAVYIGEISYGIYLFHAMIFLLLNYAVSHFYFGRFLPTYNVFLIIPLYCIVVLLVTSFTFRFIEHPFIRKP